MTTLTARSVFMLMRLDPQAGPGARERLDLALTLAASDWPLTLAFAGAGVLQLKAPERSAPLRDFAAAFASLELFGVKDMVVDRVALARYGLAAADLRLAARIVELDEIANLAGAAQVVL